MLTLSSTGKAITEKKFFSRETGVSSEINADKSIIWALLTNAADFARWNSTIISLEGNISLHEKIKLKSKLDAKRVFTLKVKELVPGSRMVWGDAMGNREYTLTPSGNNTTIFTMTEKIGGPIFPLFAKMIPPFDEVFEQFARDLKTEAETISKTN
ncbi:MAG: SRPBCC domain-containing protein [Saprospiraceae bacterium]|nr:SRPBCC domain-containing protein [Saprospiraceae bacterium]